MDLTDILDEARRRGFKRNFGVDDNLLHCHDTGERYACEDGWIVDSLSSDVGTDPGDDVTVYFVEIASGQRGYVVVPASIYAEPAKAAFIDRLRSQQPRSTKPG